MLIALVRIALGVDMALGFLNYVAWSWLFGMRFNLFFLALSIFSTHLPDADMIPYLILRKRFGLVSHWVLGHHPVLVMPIIATASFFTAKIWLPAHTGYLVALVTCGVLLHFIHDGAGKLGFPWFSPLSQTHFRFRRWRCHSVSPSEIETHRNAWRHRKCTAAEEVILRTPPISMAQLLLWGAGIAAIITFLLRKT